MNKDSTNHLGFSLRYLLRNPKPIDNYTKDPTVLAYLQVLQHEPRVYSRASSSLKP